MANAPEILQRLLKALIWTVSPWKTVPLSDWQRKQAVQQLTGTAPNPQMVTRRQQAAALIDAVLEDLLTPTQALVRWPVVIAGHNQNTSYIDVNHDPSLQAAYQILWHFEADETQQRQEPFYLDTQLALLNQVTKTLSQGHDLPMYLLTQYTTEHEAHFFSGFSFAQSALDFVAKPFRTLKAIFRQTL